MDAALKQLGCSVSLTDYYVWKDATQNIRDLLAVHIDDVLYVADPLFHAEVIEKIKSRYVIGTVEEGHFTFTGWDFSQTSAGIKLTQRSFTDKLGKATLADARRADRVLRNLRDLPQSILFSDLGEVKDLSLECWGDSSYGKFIPG